jgi:hypothetical protein
MTRDQRRYEKLVALGCIACLIDGRYSEGDIHHLVDKGSRKASGGNAASICLCPWHHRSVIPDGKTERYMREIYGPSLRLESKEFHRVYGTDRYLLGYVNNLLAGVSP